VLFPRLYLLNHGCIYPKNEGLNQIRVESPDMKSVEQLLTLGYILYLKTTVGKFGEAIVVESGLGDISEMLWLGIVITHSRSICCWIGQNSRTMYYR